MNNKGFGFNEELKSFLIQDFCYFSPQEMVKGNFLHEEFCQFLRNKRILNLPSIKVFYNSMEDWIIHQEDPVMQIKRYNYSGVVYFKGISIKGKYDNSKERLNEYKRQQMKNSRRKKAEKDGREYHERKSHPKPQAVYVTKLPNDVSEWNQHRITIENFENWYQYFIHDHKAEDIEEAYLILNEAINNFKHAKQIRPKEFDNNRFKYLLRYIEDVKDILREKADKDEEPIFSKIN